MQGLDYFGFEGPDHRVVLFESCGWIESGRLVADCEPRFDPWDGFDLRLAEIAATSPDEW